MKITQDIINKLTSIIDRGLRKGSGDAHRSFCVQQAVSFALGEEDPSSYPVLCVGEKVKEFGIVLNDQNWPSMEARGIGLRRFAIAELGSNEVSQNQFERLVLKQWNFKHHEHYDMLSHLVENMSMDCLGELAEMAVNALKFLGTEGSKFLDKPKSELEKVEKQIQKPIPQLQWRNYGQSSQAHHACYSA